MNARVALALLWLAASPLQPLDDAVRAAVQSWRRPGLEQPMHFATEGGKPLLAAAAVVALASGPVGRAVLVESALVLAPLNLVVEGIKYATDRTRPDGVHKRSNASFPSSHAANAFAMLVLLGRRWRRGIPGFALLATAVAFSRLYLDRHWFTDVVVGAGLGAALAAVVLAAWTRRWRPAAPGAGGTAG